MKLIIVHVCSRFFLPCVFAIARYIPVRDDESAVENVHCVHTKPCHLPSNVRLTTCCVFTCGRRTIRQFVARHFSIVTRSPGVWRASFTYTILLLYYTFVRLSPVEVTVTNPTWQNNITSHFRLTFPSLVRTPDPVCVPIGPEYTEYTKYPTITNNWTTIILSQWTDWEWWIAPVDWSTGLYASVQKWRTIITRRGPRCHPHRMDDAPSPRCARSPPVIPPPPHQKYWNRRSDPSTPWTSRCPITSGETWTSGKTNPW